MSDKEASEKKKLVIATDNFLPRWDGIARFLIEIINRLKEKYDITVLTANFEGHYDDPTIKIVRFPLRRFSVGDFPPAKPDKKIIREEIVDADIVWAQTIGPIGSASIEIARKMKKKIVAYNHSIEWELVPNAVSAIIAKTPLYELTKAFARRYYNKCDALFVPTREVYEKLTRHGIKTKKIVIPLGVDYDTFYPAGQRHAAKLEAGIDPSCFVIGYVGRIGREKDLITLLRAYIRIKKHDDRCRLLIVGDGVEKIKKQLAQKQGVILVGAKDNVIPYLHAMDVYVLTSLTETTSLSTLEAMSCELPVIVTRVGLLKEYVKDGVNGFLVNKKDPYSIYKDLLLLLKDPLLGPKIGAKARQTVVDEFSWKKTVQKIDAELEKLMAQSQR